MLLSLGQPELGGLPSGEPTRLVFPVFGSIYGRAGPLRWGLVELVEGVAQRIFPRFRWRHRRHLSHMWLSPCHGWLMKLTCGRSFVGCPGYRFDEEAAWTFPLLGCVTGLPECGLGWGCILVRGTDFGVLEVDFFCTLLLKIPVCWPDTRTSVYESCGWYFSRCAAG